MKKIIKYLDKYKSKIGVSISGLAVLLVQVFAIFEIGLWLYVIVFLSTIMTLTIICLLIKLLSYCWKVLVKWSNNNL